MKKTVSVFAALILCACLSVCVFAADTAGSFILDNMGYLSDVDMLNAAAQKVFEETGVAVCYASTNAVVSEADTETLLGVTADQWILLFEDPSGSHLRAGGAVLDRLTENDRDAFFSAYLDTPEDAGGEFDSAVLAYIELAGRTVSGDRALPAGAAQSVPYVVDDAGLLTDSEISALTAKAQTISEAHNCAVSIVTTSSLDGKTATAFADDYYDYNGYGVGSDHTGILFLICPEQRDWAITTTGGAIRIFTDYGQDYMVDKMKPSLKVDDYAGAFDIYLDTCEELIKAAEAGDPVDGVLQEEGTFHKLFHGKAFIGGILLSLGLGFLLSGIPMGKLKNEINNVHARTDAVEYTRPGSLQLRDQRDMFLYTNTTRTAKPKETKSSGGGSSTHFGSSGTSHGGSSGKY